MTTSVKLKNCPTCGEDKPLKLFLNKYRRVQTVCTKCRDLKRRRDRYRVVQEEQAAAEAARVVQEASEALNELKRTDVAFHILKEIRERVRHYQRRVETRQGELDTGTHNDRTSKSLEDSELKLAYWSDVLRYVKRDVARRNMQPLEFYTNNTALLIKSGFDVTPDYDEPDLEVGLYGRFAKEIDDGSNA